MTLVIIIFGEFSFADGRSHNIVSKMIEGFLGFDSGESSITGGLFFSINVILAEVSILGVD